MTQAGAQSSFPIWVRTGIRRKRKTSAEGARRQWGLGRSPRKFYFQGLGNAISHVIFRGNFHKQKHEKSLITISHTMWIQAKGETCNVHDYTTRFKQRFNDRMPVCLSIYVCPGSRQHQTLIFQSYSPNKKCRQANCFLLSF